MGNLTVNLGLDNTDLYAGCKITEVAGRLNLTTPVDEAINIIGRNISKIVTINNNSDNYDMVTLTGPMAVWAYLVVFHAVVHRYTQVWYDDGRGSHVLIAAHG